MQLSKKQARDFLSILYHLRDSGVVSADQAQRIDDAIEVTPFDWGRLARYAFWVAVVSLLIAVSALFADKWFIDLITRLFTAEDFAKMVGCAVLAVSFYGWGWWHRRASGPDNYANEALLLMGSIATAGAVGFGGKAFATSEGHFSLLFLLSTFLYLVIALMLMSRTVWFFMLLSFGSWLGLESGYMSGWGAYWLGMNYPLRFVLFGLVLVVGALLIRNCNPLDRFYGISRNFGLLYLFIALWILSIFGNYANMGTWIEAPQMTLLHWSLLFGAASFASIYMGLKLDEGAWRGYGMTFLFINLYTRFFEYFWDELHKALFFGVLGVSLWFVGKYAERQIRRGAASEIARK